MHNELKRFSDKFQSLFDDGLINVKFFVRDGENLTMPEFLAEASKIQDTISAGEINLVQSLDGSAEQRQFDAAF